jgi:hypothetical protein
MYAPRDNQRHEAFKNDGVGPNAVKSPEQPKTDEQVLIVEKTQPARIATPVQRSVKPRVRRPAQPVTQMLAFNQTTVKETTIDSWESPTSGLLSSPTDGLFKSVPQLNENANEMKSFLPGRANDKEK